MNPVYAVGPKAYKTYKRVSDDPEADPNLRNLDAARAAELRPMLTKAWLLPRLVPKDVTVLVDGGGHGDDVDVTAFQRRRIVAERQTLRGGQLRVAELPGEIVPFAQVADAVAVHVEAVEGDLQLCCAYAKADRGSSRAELVEINGAITIVVGRTERLL